MSLTLLLHYYYYYLLMLKFKIPSYYASSYSLLFRPLIRYQSNLAKDVSTSNSTAPITTSNLTSIASAPKLSINPSNVSAHEDLPINVKALYFPPMKLPVKYGHLKLDIQLRSYEVSSLEYFADFIQRVAFYLGIPMTGPKPLPRRHETWTVIRSPFVHAKSKENFERFTYKRLLRCWDTNDAVLELLLAYISKYSIAGVGVKCNLFKKEPISIKNWNEDHVLEELDTIQVNLQTNAGTGVELQGNQSNSVVDSKILELLNSSNEDRKQLKQTRKDEQSM